jgi:type IV secretory pathway VirB9-like protein
MRRFAAVILACSSLIPSAVFAQDEGARQISVSERAIVPLSAKVRYTTMIILPPDEEIAEVVCGDRGFWVISAARNIAHIKPAKTNAETNLNLITTAGSVYSFMLRETQDSPPDLKVYINSERTSIAPARQSVTLLEGQLAEVRTQLAAAQAATAGAQQAADATIAAFKQQYPAHLQFPYRVPKYGRPFLVRAVWNDGQFTYLKTDARELPALYELTDGRPAIVNYTVQHGLYVVAKVLDNAQLVLGKKRLHIEMER